MNFANEMKRAVFHRDAGNGKVWTPFRAALSQAARVCWDRRNHRSVQVKQRECDHYGGPCASCGDGKVVCNRTAKPKILRRARCNKHCEHYASSINPIG